MSLGSFHYYLLLTLSGAVLLVQTAVQCHYHQQNSYHDARSSFHASPLSLTLESFEFFAALPPVISFRENLSCIIAFLSLTPLGMAVSPWADPSPSRAPPPADRSALASRYDAGFHTRFTPHTMTTT